jgi:hypothetical protein
VHAKFQNKIFVSWFVYKIREIQTLIVVVGWTAFMLHIQEVLCSGLDLETGCSDGVDLGRCLDCTLN